jgi:hypothetical protein
VTGHSIFPHHHHEEKFVNSDQHHHEGVTPGNHHHADDTMPESKNNLFSFAELDEKFVPAKWQDLNINLPVLYLLTPLITYQLNLFRINSKNKFGYYKEYPPPCNLLTDLPSRAPPLSSSAN